MHDNEAWVKYPKYHKWFNKLYLSELLGYDCGPAGLAPTKSGWYIIRPIYNLLGMGVGARVEYIYAGDDKKIPAGYFWCEAFSGNHYSATYEFFYTTTGEWRPISCWLGTRNPGEDRLYKFSEWKRSDYIPVVPRELHELSPIGKINVEFIDDRVIEVHLRESPDPDYDLLIPIWRSDVTDIKWYDLHGFKWISDPDNADGMLPDMRLGFMVK
tara:strand:+ start:3448 stop:4086 length:639 start_codon:yes stop_codon:yes gene_type:complete